MSNTTYLIESLKYIDFLNANTDWEPMMKNFAREFAKIKIKNMDISLPPLTELLRLARNRAGRMD